MTVAERQARFREKMRALAEEPERLPSGNYRDACADCGQVIIAHSIADLDGARCHYAARSGSMPRRTPSGTRWPAPCSRTTRRSRSSRNCSATRRRRLRVRCTPRTNRKPATSEQVAKLEAEQQRRRTQGGSGIDR